LQKDLKLANIRNKKSNVSELKEEIVNNINYIKYQTLKKKSSNDIDIIDKEEFYQSIHNETKDSNYIFKNKQLKSCCLKTKEEIDKLILEKDDFIKKLQKDLERLYNKLNKQHLEKLEFEKKMTLVADNQRELILKHSEELNNKDDEIFVIENELKEKMKRVMHLEKELNSYYKKDFSSTKFVMVIDPSPVVCELNSEVETQKQIYKNLRQLYVQSQKKNVSLESKLKELEKKDNQCRCKGNRANSDNSKISNNSNITIFTNEYNEINSPNVIYFDKIIKPRNNNSHNFNLPKLDICKALKNKKNTDFSVVEKETVLTTDQLKEIVADKDKMIKILKNKINLMSKNSIKIETKENASLKNAVLNDYNYNYEDYVKNKKNSEINLQKISSDYKYSENIENDKPTTADSENIVSKELNLPDPIKIISLTKKSKKYKNEKSEDNKILKTEEEDMILNRLSKVEIK
jgi:hypothetical protein